MAGNEGHTPGYTAFISYSREDEAFAKQLETEIETYRRPGATTTAKVFRDRSDFTGSAYESALDGHLRNSKTLIVLCSPHARRSNFVGDEIKRFANHHGTERIFPILVSGLPNNEADDKKAFPPALLEVMQGSGIPLGAEYRGLDLSKERVNSGRFEGEWYKLLGNIYGVTPAELRDEDTKRQVQAQQAQVRAQQKKIALIGLALIILLAALAGTIALWQSARTAKARAQKAEAEALVLKNRAEAAEQQALAMSAKAESALVRREKEPVEQQLQKEAAQPPPVGTPSTGKQVPARVYVQVRSAQQRDLAQRWTPGLQRELQQAGLNVIVPPIEVLDVGPTKTSELRYFRDDERADAERIAEAIRAKPGMSDLTLKKVAGYEESSKMRPRHFELWVKGPGT